MYGANEGWRIRIYIYMKAVITIENISLLILDSVSLSYYSIPPYLPQVSIPSYNQPTND